MPLARVRPIPIREPLLSRLFRFKRAVPGAPPIPYIRQEQDNWCWAACGEMIIRGMGFGQIRQCEMASARAGMACCLTPDSYDCDQGAWPEVEYIKHGVDLDPQSGSLTPAQVSNELNRGRPVEVYFAWDNGGAHVALIVEEAGNGLWRIHDPWYGNAVRSFEDIITAYGMGQWSYSYINIRRRP